MTQDFITIQEAADLSNKSVQTIRRALKAKKLKSKKEKTPQGFNYLVNRQALIDLYKIKSAPKKTIKQPKMSSRMTKQATNQKVSPDNSEKAVATNDLVEFHKTLQQLIHEHSQERQSYLRLIQTLQEKIVVLENQFNLLKESSKKKWYSFWK